MAHRLVASDLGDDVHPHDMERGQRNGGAPRSDTATPTRTSTINLTETPTTRPGPPAMHTRITTVDTSTGAGDWLDHMFNLAEAKLGMITELISVILPFILVAADATSDHDLMRRLLEWDTRVDRALHRGLARRGRRRCRTRVRLAMRSLEYRSGSHLNPRVRSRSRHMEESRHTSDAAVTPPSAIRSRPPAENTPEHPVRIHASTVTESDAILDMIITAEVTFAMLEPVLNDIFETTRHHPILCGLVAVWESEFRTLADASEPAAPPHLNDRHRH